MASQMEFVRTMSHYHKQRQASIPETRANIAIKYCIAKTAKHDA